MLAFSSCRSKSAWSPSPVAFPPLFFLLCNGKSQFFNRIEVYIPSLWIFSPLLYTVFLWSISICLSFFTRFAVWSVLVTRFVTSPSLIASQESGSSLKVYIKELGRSPRLFSAALWLASFSTEEFLLHIVWRPANNSPGFPETGWHKCIYLKWEVFAGSHGIWCFGVTLPAMYEILQVNFKYCETNFEIILYNYQM